MAASGKFPRHLTASAILIAATGFTACTIAPPRETAPILLFTGTGTSANDVAAIESVLSGHHLDYATANSSQLNALDETQLRGHRLLIIPGGNFIHIGRGLTPATTSAIRNAVREGLNYLGICAGGFLAGDTGYNSVNLTGVKFGFYAAEARGIRKAAIPIAFAGGPTLDHYWEDGPQFTGWGAVVGKYPDGTPAVVQGSFGTGRVILSGVHPEAPENWRRGMSFTTPARIDNDYAAVLMEAALNGVSLPHYE
jgi:glutamine amidotransferase-like uncharacterized protein